MTLKTELINRQEKAFINQYKKEEEIAKDIIKELPDKLRKAADSGKGDFLIKIEEIPSCDDKLYVINKIYVWAIGQEFRLSSPAAPRPCTWLKITWS